MGRLFLEHMGGNRVYSCDRCDTFLTNRSQLLSKSFTGTTGTAFLFNRVVNLVHSEVHDRHMLTGQHFVRDVSCKKCGVKLGWMYEFAKPSAQRFKEGKVILEQALIKETISYQESGTAAGSAGATSGSSNVSSPGFSAAAAAHIASVAAVNASYLHNHHQDHQFQNMPEFDLDGLPALLPAGYEPHMG